MSEPILSVENLSKKYCRDLRRSLHYAARDIACEIFLPWRHSPEALRRDEFWALRDVSFTLARGESLGLIGVNGSGKSTLLKILYGILKPSAGRVRARGTMQALVEMGGGFSPTLSGRENALASLALLGLPARHVDEILAFAELGDSARAPVGTYSTGMRARLGLSIAVHAQPDILLLDEVLAVGDAAFQAKSLDRLHDLRRRASAVIFVGHHMDQVRRLCAKTLLLDRGRPAMLGETEAVIAHYLAATNTVAAHSRDVHSSPGQRLVSWRVDYGETLVYEIVLQIDEPARDLELDLLLRDCHGAPVVSKMIPLRAPRGHVTLRAEIADPHLRGGRYFPYFAVVEPGSTKKLIRVEDPVGFCVDKPTTMPCFVDPPITDFRSESVPLVSPRRFDSHAESGAPN